MRLTDVAVVVAEPVPAYELGILSEIFGLPRIDPELPKYRFAVCAENRRPLLTTSGYSVTPSHTLRRLRSADLVMVTAASPDRAKASPAVGAALRAAAHRGATVASVCTGAFALAAAGLLDGRRATTHWAHADRLALDYPAVLVEPNALYVLDDHVATSAGSSAAVDLSLELLRRAHGADIANRVAREMVVPAHRAGGQAQYVQTPIDRNPPAAESDGLAGVLDWAVEHLDADLSVPSLAARAAMSPRTFARRFTALTGTTPAAWVATQRVQHAERLLERADVTMDAVARRTGFGSADTLRRHFIRARSVPPEEYRRAFRRARTRPVPG